MGDLYTLLILPVRFPPIQATQAGLGPGLLGHLPLLACHIPYLGNKVFIIYLLGVILERYLQENFGKNHNGEECGFIQEDVGEEFHTKES